MKKTALLVVDVQQALCTGEEAAFDIDRVIERINALVTNARSTGAPVIFIQHEEDGGLLQFDTDAWQLAKGLAVRPGDLRVRKMAPDSFDNTGLQSLLQERGVERLVVCGLQTDCCVNATVRGAAALGYEVVLAADAHSTVDNGAASQVIADHNKALAANLGASVAVVPVIEVRIAA
jgi:nicotinamidase-related amidase